METVVKQVKGLPTKKIFQGGLFIYLFIFFFLNFFFLFISIKATYCCVSEYENGIPDYVSSFKDYLFSLSLHRYPQSVCNGKNTTLTELLKGKKNKLKKKQLIKKK